MRLVVCVLAAAAIAGPAFAMLAPQYYEEARTKAPDVVVFKVTKVEGRRPSDGLGQCTVTGVVEAVERGSHYRAGGPVTVAVPCRWPGADNVSSCVIYQTPEALKRSRRGRVWMESPGKLALQQYEILA